MKKNFILLAALVKSLQISLANSTLKDTKDTLVVIKVIKKNLFYLQGSTIVREVAMTSHISTTDDDFSRL